ncbi:MAG: hypothetical protein RL283_531 [Actinomycetota bacterium]
MQGDTRERGERAFTDRHIGIDDDARARMLATVGAPSLDALIDEVVPASIRHRGPLPLPRGLSEPATIARLRALAADNRVRRSLIGMGYHPTVTPPVILRNVLENPAWYTAYTPYQPEISQGRLEALLNFQTVVTELTGLPVANASLLDEATAAAEAMTLARRTSKSPTDAFLVDADTHPQTIAVLRTRAEAVGIDVVVLPRAELGAHDCYGALVSWPSSTGEVAAPEEVRAVTAALHARGAVAVAATDPLALAILATPASLGFDVAIGSAQRYGVPMGGGGPHAAYMGVAEGMARAIPGRIVGVSHDAAGRPALRLALQTREQHIRREKATSNICTAQALLANIAGFYAAWHGADGLAAIAERVHRLADALAEGLRRAGLPPVHATRVDTVTVAYPTEREADAAVARAADAGLLLRRVDATRVGASLDETCDEGVVAAVLAALTGRTDGADPVALAAGAPDGIPAGARRDEPFLRQATFRRYRTEHEMLRYLRRLADRDLALDRTMIPLGSCTMKLNATTEMLAVTWPEFADLHPYAPAEDLRGSERLVQELESMLVAVTGYDAVSLQPNAGSQGELAGLLAIRAYHRSRHEEGRTVCLIPSSAHGTNAASAVMAGLRVVVVACDPHGNVDVDDLRAKCEAAGDALAALMVTYPSTHGVFEERIGEICELVHRHGGQVYVDGANLNALVGLARPGAFGADVSHLNLHKTFCIPHGGGGPGVGPVAVREHLAKFLPAHPLESAAAADEGRVGAVSAAPWGSAGILPISWAYVTLMGGEGLRAATEHAILAANYVAERLHARYPVLYRGERGRVAHECILDLRPIAARTGVTNDDVAKRLMDFGFHAPTMSFPVAGTLMVEPTESETIEELDRFCDAMLAIADEIDAIERGDIAVDDSPLRHAPHPVEDLVRGWDRRYSPETAAYPVPSLRSRGYFPPVSRIDAAAGDRTLVCACDPISAYAAGG